MAGMTSGKRAELANHDPYPWITRKHAQRFHNEQTLGTWPSGCDYDPRPEFDVPDNPILTQFRGRLRYQARVKRPVSASALANIWLTDLYRHTWDHQHDTPSFEHARRVLSKLAAVYA